MSRRAPNKPIPPLTEQQKRNFWAKVKKGGLFDCWLWQGATCAIRYTHIRYGQFRVGAKMYKPHRVAYVLTVGPIPEGLTIDHVRAFGCESTLCVNPGHLQVVTMTEQHRRRRKAHRAGDSI